MAKTTTKEIILFFFYHLQDIPRQVITTVNAQRDLAPFVLHAPSALDLVVTVTAGVAGCGHDHHLFEVRNVWDTG